MPEESDETTDIPAVSSKAQGIFIILCIGVPVALGLGYAASNVFGHDSNVLTYMFLLSSALYTLGCYKMFIELRSSRRTHMYVSLALAGLIFMILATGFSAIMNPPMP